MAADAVLIADRILQAAGTSPRFMVAVAGPPGAGKSTLSAALLQQLQQRQERAAVVPMDGFHFDDSVLNARGQRTRKGAAFTFDCAGLEILLRRIRSHEPDVAIPIFDRTLELSRAAAAVVAAETRIVLVEGNYLLLNQPPWTRLHGLFDYRVFLEAPPEELQRRLLQRIQAHGFSLAHAQSWISGNDLPNIQHVLTSSIQPDLCIRSPTLTAHEGIP
ncbi:MAG: nucleoside/nucleotide kinase family protein [Planctomycetota bacterium]